MYNAKEMQKAVTDSIRQALESTRFKNISVSPEDEDEDILRPSVRIMTDTKYSKEMMVKVAETTVEVFFYAESKDEYTVDCLEVQDLIQNRILEGITEENIQPDNVDCSTSGGVLAISFALEQMEAIVEEGETDIGSLELNIKS